MVQSTILKMTPAAINVLMTGAGAPGAAGILKCLHSKPGITIIAADANSNAVGRWLNGDSAGVGFEKVPPAHDANFIEQMLSICERRNIQIVMPLVTKELIPLAQYKRKFEKQ